MRINIGRVKEITKDWVKSVIYGNVDVRTGEQMLPHGIDSKPVMDSISLYIQTDDSSEAVHVGYLSTSDKTKPGELRLFATDSNGVEKFSVLFDENGVCKFNGDDDNFVRYSELKKEYDKTKAVVDIISQTLKKWTVAPSDGGKALQTAYVLAIGAKTTGDISGSKISNIKCSKTD